jgi:Arc/MetJ-type ribon-helix-helix transcriptional regulator
MKHKLSVSIDENTVLEMFEKIRDGTFRNKSHLVEFAIKRYLEEVGLQA